MYILQISTDQVFGLYGETGWLHWSSEQQWGILYAQNFMLVIFVWCTGKKGSRFRIRD